MSQSDFMEFIKRILREDTVSEFDLYGILEKIISNASIISGTEICLN